MSETKLSEYIDAGAAKLPADLVITGGTLINVNTGEYYKADVAIYDQRIVAVEKISPIISAPTLERLMLPVSILPLG